MYTRVGKRVKHIITIVHYPCILWKYKQISIIFMKHNICIENMFSNTRTIAYQSLSSYPVVKILMNIIFEIAHFSLFLPKKTFSLKGTVSYRLLLKLSHLCIFHYEVHSFCNNLLFHHWEEKNIKKKIRILQLNFHIIKLL